MDKKTEALKLALEALELYQSKSSVQMFDDAVKALREAMAQPAQQGGGNLPPPLEQPVAWLELLREARDNCKASIVEEGISASRKEYRIDLESRLTAALNTSPPAQQEPVAYRSRLKSGSYTYCNTAQFFDNAEPLYTSPQPTQQEPVARYFEQWQGQPIQEIDEARFNQIPEECRFKLYTTPPASKPLTDEQKDAARWRFLVENSFDKEGVTQFHVWEHSWEPHSQTGEPTEWKQRVRGHALDRFIDRAIEATLGITGEQK